MSLQQIFDIVEKKSHNLRKSDPNANGLKFWHPIKKTLSTLLFKS